MKKELWWNKRQRLLHIKQPAKVTIYIFIFSSITQDSLSIFPNSKISRIIILDSSTVIEPPCYKGLSPSHLALVIKGPQVDFTFSESYKDMLGLPLIFSCKTPFFTMSLQQVGCLLNDSFSLATFLFFFCSVNN